ncbi:hypothetical protein ASE28_02225 [Acidovorax sp. Root219]|nr:hypothetical protein ASE28_02225 [Acidovorax sp. Root219]
MTALGIAGSVAYLFFLNWLVNGKWGALRAPDVKLNELGDFLAGAFGPLAIWWLVLGYFQQGRELKINSDALLLQLQELENSVQQQGRLVGITQDQYTLDTKVFDANQAAAKLAADNRTRQAQPVFKFKSDGYDRMPDNRKHIHKLRVTNIGHACSDLTIYTDSLFIPHSPENVDHLDRTQGFSMQFVIDHDEGETSEMTFTFVDGEQNLGSQKFTVDMQYTAVRVLSPKPDLTEY